MRRPRSRPAPCDEGPVGREPDRRWLFDPFVPARGAPPPTGAGDPEGEPATIPRASAPTDERAAEPRDCELAPGAGWRGFTHRAPGHAMTDPNKLALLTPGFDRRSGD